MGPLCHWHWNVYFLLFSPLFFVTRSLPWAGAFPNPIWRGARNAISCITQWEYYSPFPLGLKKPSVESFRNLKSSQVMHQIRALWDTIINYSLQMAQTPILNDPGWLTLARDPPLSSVEMLLFDPIFHQFDLFDKRLRISAKVCHC